MNKDKVIVAIDPGSEKSGYAIYQGRDLPIIDFKADCPNETLISHIISHRSKLNSDFTFVIEMIGHYGTGMSVGKDVFHTCVWIGRFIEGIEAYYRGKSKLLKRTPVKLALCGSIKAKDSNVNQFILDYFPQTGGGATPSKGVKKNPGPLFGMTAHAIQALAIAVAVRDFGVNDWVEL